MKRQAKLRRKIEEGYPLALSILFSVFFFSCVPITYWGRILSSEFLGLSITISTVNFGFLLAVLAILLSLSNNKSIELLNRNKQTHTLIRYNKTAVYSSFFDALITTILLLKNNPPAAENDVKYYTWWGIFILWVVINFYMIISTFRYVHIFYRILSEDKYFGKPSR